MWPESTWLLDRSPAYTSVDLLANEGKQDWRKANTLDLVFLISEMGLIRDPLGRPKGSFERCSVPVALGLQRRKGRVFPPEGRFLRATHSGQRESCRPSSPVGPSPGWWAGSPCWAK